MSEQTKVSSEAKLIAKITVKAVGRSPKLGATSDAPVHLCDIYGTAIGTKMGEDPRDGKVWVALLGNFEAINAEDGQRYQSDKLFLPVGQELLQKPLEAAEKNNETLSIDFAYRIFSVKSSNAAGYSYECKPLLEQKAEDHMSRLRALVYGSDGKKQIEAPTNPVPKPAPQPAPSQKRK